MPPDAAGATGAKTSEFWLSITTLLLGAGLAVFGALTNNAQALNWGCSLVATSAVGYTAGRNILKVLAQVRPELPLVDAAAKMLPGAAGVAVSKVIETAEKLIDATEAAVPAAVQTTAVAAAVAVPVPTAAAAAKL